MTKIRRFYDSRSLHAFLMTLRTDRLAEVTESKTEHGFTVWLVQVSDPNKPEKETMTLAEARENLAKLRAETKGRQQNAFDHDA